MSILPTVIAGIFAGMGAGLGTGFAGMSAAGGHQPDADHILWEWIPTWQWESHCPRMC